MEQVEGEVTSRQCYEDLLQNYWKNPGIPSPIFQQIFPTFANHMKKNYFRNVGGIVSGKFSKNIQDVLQISEVIIPWISTGDLL